jgi:hypothetical protein
MLLAQTIEYSQHAPRVASGKKQLNRFAKGNPTSRHEIFAVISCPYFITKIGSPLASQPVATNNAETLRADHLLPLRDSAVPSGSFLRSSIDSPPPVLRFFLLGTAALFLLDFITWFICAHIVHLTAYPYGFYMVRHNEDGLDLMGYYVRFKQFHSVGFFRSDGGPVYAYPAGVAPFYWIFYRVRYAQIPFVLVSLTLLLTLAVLLARALERHGLSRKAARLFVGLSLVLSYPLYFECTRGNMELFMWLFSACGTYAVLRKRPWLGATLIGVATAMKLYPFILVGLLIARRKYWQTAFTFLVAAIMTYICYWLICPDISVSIAGIHDGMAKFQVKYVLAYWVGNLDWDHSLFGVVKRIVGDQSTVAYTHILSIYMILCAGIGTVLYFIRIRRMPAINQVLCLSVASIMMPPISFDYTLVHLYAPWAMLVILVVDTFHSGRSRIPGLWPVFGCFIILLSPLNEFIVHGHRMNGNIRAFVLLALFILGLVYPFPSWMDTAEHSEPRPA